MDKFLIWVDNYGAKFLGLAQGTAAALAGIAGLIPENHLKYWLAASAVLSVAQGYAQPNTPKR